MRTSREHRAESREQREKLAYKTAEWIMIVLIIIAMVVIVAKGARAEGLDGRWTMDEKAWTDRTYRTDIPLTPALSPQAERESKLAMLAAYALIDYRQSCEMFYNRAGYYEINPVLGKQPSRRDMAVFGVAGIALTWAASEILGTDLVLDSVMATEAWNIEDNARVADGKRRRINAIPIIISWRF